MSSEQSSTRADPALVRAVDSMNAAIHYLLNAGHAGWADEVASVRNRAEKAGGAALMNRDTSPEQPNDYTCPCCGTEPGGRCGYRRNPPAALPEPLSEADMRRALEIEEAD